MKTNLFEFMGLFSDRLEKRYKDSESLYLAITNDIKKSEKLNKKYNPKYIDNVITYLKLGQPEIGSIIIFSNKSEMKKSIEYIESLNFDLLLSQYIRVSSNKNNLKTIFLNRGNILSSIKTGNSFYNKIKTVINNNKSIISTSTLLDAFNVIYFGPLYYIYVIHQYIEKISLEK